MPVLPAVASIIVPPGFSSPDFSASSMIESPIRSLIEPPGLLDSNLTYKSHGPVSRDFNLRIGVFPIRSIRDSVISISFFIMYNFYIKLNKMIRSNMEVRSWKIRI